MEFDHLSYSQLSMFVRCPKQWAYRYGEGLIIPPAGAMVKGSAVHKGIEGNYIQKVDSEHDLPKTDVIEMSVTEFETRQTEVEWDREDETPAKAKDAVVTMTGIYQDDIAPQVQPLLVEQYFNLNIAGEQVTGIMDVVTVNSVRDTKTSGKTPPADTATNSLQLTCYSWAFEDIFGVLPQALILDYAVNLKTPKTVSLFTTPNPRLKNILVQTVSNVASAIRAEVFYPNINGWHCSPKMCGYYVLCRG